METKDVLKKVDMLNIDSRFSLIVASYFCAKVKLGEITEETIDGEIANFQQRIKHFEFIKSSKFRAAYEKTIGTITLNKDFLNQDNLEEILPLVFMKIEEALNLPHNNEDAHAWRQGDALLHIKSFQKAMRLLQELNLPYNDNYDGIYNILNIALDKDGKALDEEIRKDRPTEVMCYDIDELFNKVVARGEWDTSVISEIINLYRYRVIIDEENGIDVTSEEYKKGLQKVIQYMQKLHDNNYADINGCKGNIEKLLEMIGISKESIEENQIISSGNQSEKRNNERLSESIMTRFVREPEELTQEYIQERVSRLIEEKPDYDRRLSYLLPHFFLRSAAIYEWSKDDFEQRINSIDSTIQKIGFVYMDNIYVGGDTVHDGIRINARMHLDSKGKIKNDRTSLLALMRTFFHEAGHSTDKSIREQMTLQERLAPVTVDDMFYEWSNTIFERAIMGHLYSDESAMTLNQNSGYESMANAGSIIAAALRMNEIEFARLKDAGLEQNMEYFNERFAYYPGLYEKLKTTFTIPSLKTEGRESKRMHQEMYKEVYSLCLDVLDSRIEHEMQEGKIEDLDEYQELQRYFLRKMNLNYEIASKKYGLKREARKIVHRTKYATDKISKKAIKKIGNRICSECEFGFQNEDILEELKYRDRKPTLRESLKMRFGKVMLLEAGRQQENTSEKSTNRGQFMNLDKTDDDFNR